MSNSVPFISFVETEHRSVRSLADGSNDCVDVLDVCLGTIIGADVWTGYELPISWRPCSATAGDCQELLEAVLLDERAAS